MAKPSINGQEVSNKNIYHSSRPDQNTAAGLFSITKGGDHRDQFSPVSRIKKSVQANSNKFDESPVYENFKSFK